uniref:Reverse transcriptase domain-containing protein n=1 Tax=Tanacetum cinerariifolium TaxID=118510 RepID=A0A6L2K0A6_TANCI|nr:hypothetical protein [Tanacetum cinerariifolium]
MHTVAGDGVAGIKRHRCDLSSDGVRNLVTASGRSRLKGDLESSTWRWLQDYKVTPSRRIMNPQDAQQVAAHDEIWVSLFERVKFWYSIKMVQGMNSYEFLLANKNCVVIADVFRIILDIYPRVKGVNFTDVPDDDTTLAFLIKLGYKGLLYKHTNMFVDHMQQPWRTLAAIINKRLSGKTTINDKLPIKQSESYQMFIKYSTGQIFPKKSRGNGSQRKKTADDSQETVDVSEESEHEPKPVNRKTASRRVVKKKVIIFVIDNIILDLDVSLELGKSISITEAEEEEAAKQVHATHARITLCKLLKKARRQERDNQVLEAQVKELVVNQGFSMSPQLSLLPQVKELYKIRVRKDEDEEMINVEVDDSDKGDEEVIDAAKADTEKTLEVKDDAKKSKLPPTSLSLSVSLGFGDQFLKLYSDFSLVSIVKDIAYADVISLMDILIQQETPQTQCPSVQKVPDDVPPLWLEGLPFELEWDHLPNYTIRSSNSFEWHKIIFEMIINMGTRHVKAYTLRERYIIKTSELNLNTSVRTMMKSERWNEDLSPTEKLLQPFGHGLLWSVGNEKELWDLRVHRTGKEAGSQQNKFTKTHLAVHNIKQREYKSTKDFITRYADDSLQILGLHEKQCISGFVHGLRIKSLVEHLFKDLPTTYKGLMEKTYTWIEAREVATNETPNDQRENFERSRKSYQNDNRGQKDRDRFSPYRGPSHRLLSTMSKSPREILATEKAARSFEQPPQRNNSEVGEIKFRPLRNISSADPVIIKAYVPGRQVNRVYLDRGSSCEVIYEHCFLKLKPSIQSLRVDSMIPLVGFSREISWPLGEVPLEITIEVGPLTTTKTLNFVIMGFDLPHNIILKRIAMQQMGIVVSTIHGAIKFNMPQGVGTVLSQYNPREPKEEQRATSKQHQEEVKSILSCVDTRERIAVNDRYPEQTIAIGRELPTKTKIKLQDLLRIINELKHLVLVKQKKRGMALERNEVIYTQVEDLTKANILQEVKYQMWVSNPVKMEAVRRLHRHKQSLSQRTPLATHDRAKSQRPPPASTKMLFNYKDPNV